MAKTKTKVGNGKKQPRKELHPEALLGTQDEMNKLYRLLTEKTGEISRAHEARHFAEKQRDALKEQLDQPKDFPVQQFGMIPWPIAERAWVERLKKYPTSTPLKEYAMRGGFHINEMDEFLPTWRDEVDELVRLRKRTAELEHYAISFPATVEAFIKASRELDEERARRTWAEEKTSHGPMVNYGGRLALPNWFAESEAVREYFRAATKPKGGGSGKDKATSEEIEAGGRMGECKNCGFYTSVYESNGCCLPCVNAFGDLCDAAKGRGEKSVDIAATWAKTKETVLAGRRGRV